MTALVLFGPLLSLPLANVERVRLRMIGMATADPHRTPPGPGLWHWIRQRYTESATWRELAYMWLISGVFFPLSFVVVSAAVAGISVFLLSPFLLRGDGTIDVFFYRAEAVSDSLPLVLVGVLMIPVFLYALGLLAGLHGLVARALLSPWGEERLRAELSEVSRSRARIVDAFEAERRRIERDLHDGAQQRLVALAMQLGLARMDVPADSPARDTLASAHEQAKDLIEEMRELVRGIHPKVLTDLGLPAAVAELTDRTTIPVEVTILLDDRLPSHVESTAYFVVAEAFTNIAKHSGATQAWVRARLTTRPHDSSLELEITDNGEGGADANFGTGLTGMEDRVSVVGGRMTLTSPVGGPTRLTVELPCQEPSV
ncbi:sensor histidine kinase [Spiractinospora alimapuensis]|uniref:sensor histidine kinase n=1 Tax=Spiractinospora alimapuensis TaxID=2820884 RepID=UPI001F310514|nr:sensor histidine kinase [Spiractinospora alimapuensis]